MFAMPEPCASAGDGQLRMIAAIADGRRGEIEVVSAPCAESYLALTPECPQAHWFERELDEQGRFGAYKVVDPSFHNWFGLAMAMRNQQISDFPLCNKSFNLSYCGHDL